MGFFSVLLKKIFANYGGAVAACELPKLVARVRFPVVVLLFFFFWIFHSFHSFHSFGSSKAKSHNYYFFVCV